MSADLSDLHAFVAVGARERLSRRRAGDRHQRLGPQRGGAAPGDAARCASAEPHHAQRGPDRGRRALAVAARAGARRGAVRARRGQRLSRRPAGRHAAPERAAQRRAPGAARDRAAFPGRLSRDPPGSGRRRELRRRAGSRLRCRHPLRGTARTGHDRGADRPARAAHGAGRLAGLSRSPWATGASARAAASRMHPRPLSGPRDGALGFRARRREAAHRAGRAIAGGAGRGLRPRRRRGRGRHRPGLSVRGLASAAFDSGALERVLEPWWDSFSGPFLYYPGRRLVPAPLRAFIDFIRAESAD